MGSLLSSIIRIFSLQLILYCVNLWWILKILIFILQSSLSIHSRLLIPFSLIPAVTSCICEFQCLPFLRPCVIGLCNPEVQFRIHKGFPIIPVLSWLNPIPHIDTYFFRIHSNIVIPKDLFPMGVPVKILKPLFLYSGYMTCSSYI